MASLYRTLLSLVFVSRVWARATSRQTGPTVDVLNGSYTGYYASAYNTDNFLGVPYAQPPVGDLRFRVPQSLNSTWSGSRDATEYSAECFGYGLDTESQGNNVSEDCLYLNVVRPAGLAPTSGLPIGFWIHGGGLVMGGAPDHRYNLSFIVQQSMEAGSPMIGVSINYRLSAWGFLYGQEVQESGNTMLGFRDQRLALHWIQENIAAFGGDPAKVTIWGESSGGTSVGAQLLAYNGRNDNIFAGAIAESGAPVSINPYPTVQTWEPVYQDITAAAGCSGSADTLACLRTLSTAQMNSIINSSVTASASYGPVIDGDFVQAPASVQLQQGNFVKVPYLIGQNSDEGTAFGPKGINTTAQFMNWVISLGFDNDTASTMSYLYPDIPAIGVPSTIQGRPPATAKLGYQYKRASAAGGDTSMHAPRRLTALAYAAQHVPVYTYRFNVLVNGQPYTSGATHFQEVAFVFYNTDGLGYRQNLNPNPLGGVDRAQYLALAQVMTRMWIGFIAHADPNSALGGVHANTWPAYTLDAPMNFVFDANVTSYAEMDTYRAEGINFVMDLMLARKGSNCTGLIDCGAPMDIEYGDTGGAWGL